MANWVARVDIRKYIDVDVGEDYSQITSEVMLKVAEGIAGEMAGLPPDLGRSAKLKNVLSALRSAADTGELNWFNASLSRLWDWLDENRVWVEL